MTGELLSEIPETKMKPITSKECSPGSWIIFSYFFNIDGKASSQHIDDRIPHLASLGVKPFIVSSICAERNSSVANFRVPSVAPSGVRFELRYLKRRNKGKLLLQLEILD